MVRKEVLRLLEQYCRKCEEKSIGTTGEFLDWCIGYVDDLKREIKQIRNGEYCSVDCVKYAQEKLAYPMITLYSQAEDEDSKNGSDSDI